MWQLDLTVVAQAILAKVPQKAHSAIAISRVIFPRRLQAVAVIWKASVQVL